MGIYANCGALKMFSNYECGTKVDFVYDFEDIRYLSLKSKYPFEEAAAGADSTAEKAIAVLKWLSANVAHDGSREIHPYDSLTILDYAFGKGPERGVSCFCLSVILSECLLSIGIEARILHLMPYSPYDWDCHVVVMAYIAEWGKWILLDPTYNGYFLDEEHRILGPLEIRDKLANRENIYCNPDIMYNNVPTEQDEIISYYAKNMFYFFSNEINTFNAEFYPTRYGYRKEQRNIYLNPIGFHPLDHRIEKTKYILSKITADKTATRALQSSWSDQLKFLEESKTHHISTDVKSFFKNPTIL